MPHMFYGKTDDVKALFTYSNVSLKYLHLLNLIIINFSTFRKTPLRETLSLMIEYNRRRKL